MIEKIEQAIAIITDIQDNDIPAEDKYNDTYRMLIDAEANLHVAMALIQHIELVEERLAAITKETE